MAFWHNLFGTRGVSRRASLENPNTPLSAVTLDDLFGDYASDAGEEVTPKKAIAYAPVYQAVGMISGDAAKIPLNVFRRLEGRGREIDLQHPVAKLLRLQGSPDGEINAFKWWRRWFVSALVWGNAYAWIERDMRSRPMGIYMLLPDRTYMARRNKQLKCITEAGGKLWELPAADVLHLEGLSIDLLQGCDLINLFRQDFGLALAQRKFTSKFFGQGANVGGILSVPPGANPEAVKKVQASVAEKFTGGTNSFKTIVLRDGFKWFGTQVDPKKVSVDTIDERQTIHVAQIYNIHTSRLGVKGSASYNSQEQAKQDYNDSTLSPWLIGTKAECELKLLSQEERDSGSVFVDYNINALLWADAKSRSEIARTGILAGRFTINETRAWENLNPVPGGDDLLIPLNMVRLDAVTGNIKPLETPKRTKGEGDGHALRDLMASLLTRVVGRMKNQATKHRGDAHRTAGAWTETSGAMAEIIAPGVAVARMYEGVEIDATELVADLCHHFTERMATAAGGDPFADANAVIESILTRRLKGKT